MGVVRQVIVGFVVACLAGTADASAAATLADLVGTYPLTFQSSIRVPPPPRPKLVSDQDSTTGTCELLADGSFVATEFDGARTNVYTGGFALNSKGTKVTFTLDDAGIEAVRSTVGAWLEEFAAEQGSSLTDLDVRIDTARFIRKATVRRGGLTRVKLVTRGTATGVLDGDPLSKRFRHTSRVEFGPRSPVVEGVCPCFTADYLSSVTWDIWCGGDETFGYLLAGTNQADPSPIAGYRGDKLLCFTGSIHSPVGQEITSIEAEACMTLVVSTGTSQGTERACLLD